jgi:hypothetical protein
MLQARHLRVTVELLLVDSARAVEGLADERGLHGGDMGDHERQYRAMGKLTSALRPAQLLGRRHERRTCIA